MTVDTPQRTQSVREELNGLHRIVRAGATWRLMLHALPWYTVYQQSQCWLKAGVFAALVHDLRVVHMAVDTLGPLIEQ